MKPAGRWKPVAAGAREEHSMTLQAPPVSDTATLTVDGTTIELPVVQGSEGERAIDISTLRASTGLVTLDPGYGNTGSCSSAITFIDGEEGVLRYRGYPIEELAARSDFLETSYLILQGDLPTQAQLDEFTGRITHHTLLHEGIRNMYGAFPRQAHPDGHGQCDGGVALRLLPGLARPRGRRPHRDLDAAAAGEAAHDLRLRLQVQHRSALQLPAQRALLRREHAPHDVRQPGRRSTRSTPPSPGRWRCC